MDTRSLTEKKYDVRRISGLPTTFMNGAWCANPTASSSGVVLHDH